MWKINIISATGGFGVIMTMALEFYSINSIGGGGGRNISFYTELIIGFIFLLTF